MIATARRVLAVVVLTSALAACGAQESPPEVIRPVQLTQVTIGDTVDTAVFAGEVQAAPRERSRLSHRRQDRRAPGRRRRPRPERAGARAARSHRRGTAGPGGGGATGRHRNRIQVRAGRVRPLPEPAAREIRQRVGAGRQAQHARGQSREVPAGQGQPRRFAKPGELCDAGGQRGRRGDVGQRRDGAGRRGGSGGAAHRPRGRARGRDQRSGEPHRGTQGCPPAGGGAVGEPGQAVSGRVARSLAVGGPGHPDVCGARIDARDRSVGAIGHDRQRGPGLAARRRCGAVAVDLDLPQGRQAGRLALRPRQRARLPWYL